MVLAHLEAEKVQIGPLSTTTQNLWQVSYGIDWAVTQPELVHSIPLIYQPGAFYVLQFTTFFPDLYAIEPAFESNSYQTFLKYSLFRMGLKEHELYEMFTTNIEHYQDYKEPEIDYSNSI
jgi:hypothetical protein